jgi:LAGLIDADG endonuclease
MGNYVVRDKKQLNDIIIPIFNKYSLLTTKYFYFDKLKKILKILNNTALSKEEKNEKINNIKKDKPVKDYMSPAWSLVLYKVENYNDASKVLFKAWLIGFIEAEGSFYLVKKEENRIVHGFGLTQKLDSIVLFAIKYILHIPTNVRFKEKHNYYILDTTNSRAIENIIDYFCKTMKGVKSLEYKIWARAYKYKGNFNKLNKIQNQIRTLRKYRPDIDKIKIYLKENK